MAMLKVGSIVLATDQGLGILAKSFYDAGIITDVLVVKHGTRPTHQSWYPTSQVVQSITLPRVCEEFIRTKKLDCLLFFETPFHWPIIDIARRMKVKTILMPMYECMPRVLPYQPDAILNPSLLDQQYYPHGTYIPVPVATDVIWRQRDRAHIFVHNAGHGGLRDRNGTPVLLQAMQYVQSPIKLILRTQKRLDGIPHDTRIDYRVGTIPHSELWTEGDVFTFPEVFNGLSLPLQEAYASGMLVMSTARYPMTTWLPTAPLVPVSSYQRACISGRCHEFDEAIISPRELARTIDEWYGRPIGDYSSSGREWAKGMTWDILKPQYMEFIERVVGS